MIPLHAALSLAEVEARMRWRPTSFADFCRTMTPDYEIGDRWQTPEQRAAMDERNRERTANRMAEIQAEEDANG